VLAEIHRQQRKAADGGWVKLVQEHVAGQVLLAAFAAACESPLEPRLAAGS